MSKVAQLVSICQLIASAQSKKDWRDDQKDGGQNNRHIRQMQDQCRHYRLKFFCHGRAYRFASIFDRNIVVCVKCDVGFGEDMNYTCAEPMPLKAVTPITYGRNVASVFPLPEELLLDHGAINI